mgnify:CR=1 FL=1
MTNELPAAVTADLLTLQQAADYVSTSLRHMRRLASNRQIPTVKIGHLVRIKRTDLDAFINANTRQAIGG